MAASDLDEDELAAYLHVTPQQVRKLADRGQIPGRRVSGQWRFSEAEIHVWLEQQIGASDPDELPQVQAMVNRWSKTPEEEISIADLLHPDAIEVPLQARTPRSVVRRICQMAANTGLLWDADRMRAAVSDREDLHPTALDNGVAMLHPRRPQASILAEPLVALAVSSQPLPFGNRSGHLTDVFFLICSTNDRVHLKVLAKLSRLLSMDDFLQSIRSAPDSKTLHSIVREYEQQMDDQNEPA